MDTIISKIEKHTQVISKYLNDLAEEKNNALGNEMTYQTVLDIDKKHFLLIQMGWKDHTFLYSVLIHLDIHPETGNIWIQQNNTEVLLTQEMEEMGIPKAHFVLGFRSEAMRIHSEYAVS